MRKIIFVLTGIIVTLACLTSCLKDNDTETEQSNDAAITSFTLGTLNRYPHTTSTTGADSVYKVSFSASSYTMTIDQLGGKIYNVDSLPENTDIKHVVCTIGTRNSSIPCFMKENNDTLWYYNSTDSFDLSSLRILRVYATNLKDYRDYSLTLNVKKRSGTSIVWEESALADWPGKASAWKGAATSQGLTPIGESAKEQFAMSSDGSAIMVSKDGGLTWVYDAMEPAADRLPSASDLACTSWPLRFSPNSDYTIMVGTPNYDSDRKAVWRKLADYDLGAASGTWTELTTDDATYFLPSSGACSLVYYNGAVLAFYDDGTVYESLDDGVKWEASSDYTFPDGDATAKPELATDAEGYLWLKSGDRVWKGKK